METKTIKIIWIIAGLIIAGIIVWFLFKPEEVVKPTIEPIVEPTILGVEPVLAGTGGYDASAFRAAQDNIYQKNQELKEKYGGLGDRLLNFYREIEMAIPTLQEVHGDNFNTIWNDKIQPKLDAANTKFLNFYNTYK